MSQFSFLHNSVAQSQDNQSYVEGFEHAPSGLRILIYSERQNPKELRCASSTAFMFREAFALLVLILIVGMYAPIECQGSNAYLKLVDAGPHALGNCVDLGPLRFKLCDFCIAFFTQPFGSSQCCTLRSGCRKRLMVLSFMSILDLRGCCFSYYTYRFSCVLSKSFSAILYFKPEPVI